MQRDRWNNRAAFVLAAIGSAAGLGNAWRFPYIAYANGGGAFLIPYFVALLTTGLPLIAMEYALGQKTQQGAPGSLGKIRKPFEIFGWFAVLAGAVITTYYAAIMAWIWDYLKACFTVEWIGGAKEYFYENVLQLSSGPGELGGIAIPVFLGLALTWIAIYYILRNGVKDVGKVVLFTVPVPVILLGLLVIRAVTLPGAIDGINYYLTPDFSKLLDPDVWIAAYSQIFFTLSLGFGIMIAYASYMPEDSDITNNAMITVFANSAISFLAGFAIFGTLGYMANVNGVPVSEVATDGVGLAFVVYPEAIKLLPGGNLVVGIFGFVFFMMLLTLGIDSAFSIVEAGIAGLEDKWGWKRRRITFWFCLFSLVVGLLFATKAGLYWLDIVDHWVNNFGLTIAALLELIVIGWVVKPKTLRDYFNPISEFQFGSWWDFCIKYLSPLILIFLIGRQFYIEFTVPYGGYEPKYLWLGGWGVLIAMGVLAFLLGRSRPGANVAKDESQSF